MFIYIYIYTIPPKGELKSKLATHTFVMRLKKKM